MTKYDKSDDLVSGATPATTPTVTRVYLTPGRLGSRGQTYNAHLGSPDGEQIVTNASDVGYAACRALKARGVTGRMETWHVGSAHLAMLFPDICEAAEWTVRECPKRGLRRVRHKPWNGAAVSQRSCTSGLGEEDDNEAGDVV
jgi:hypothetical protein